jgi:hypothetical protein
MLGLTSDQIRFLKEQKIHPKFIYDAQGLSQPEYRLIMKDLNKIIAYNVTPCRKEGHTLRTRSGHCCQCDTAKIAFITRNDSSGVVYIAGSLAGQVIKIGFTKAVKVRSESLNRTKYAGFNDWKILYALESKFAGRIETKSNSLLHKYSYSLDYDHDGHWQDSYETYRCSYSKTKEFVRKVYESENFKIKIIRNVSTDDYEFKKRIVQLNF